MKVVFKLGNKVAGSANVPKQPPVTTNTQPEIKTPPKETKTSPKVVFKTSVKKTPKRKREPISPETSSTQKRTKQTEKKNDDVLDEGTVITAPKLRIYSLKKVLNTTLKKLIEIDHYNIFYEPVTEETAPGYFSVVSKPMDFTTMRTKINDDKYQYYSQFQADFDLMCDNALRYNAPDTVYYEEAKRMHREGKAVFKSQSQFLKPDVLKPLKPIPHTPTPSLSTQSPINMAINQDLIVQRILPKEDTPRYKLQQQTPNSLRVQPKTPSSMNYLKKNEPDWNKRRYEEQRSSLGYATPNHNVSNLVVQPTPTQSQPSRSHTKHPIERPLSYSLFNPILELKFGGVTEYESPLSRYKVSKNFVNYTKGLYNTDLESILKNFEKDQEKKQTLKGYFYKTIYYPRIVSYLDDIKSKDDMKAAKYLKMLDKNTQESIKKQIAALIE